MRRFRVLDLSGLEGQFAGKMLADLGFEVIKVEPPGGDPVRRLAPFKDRAPDPDASLPFLYLNSNKKSITLNLEAQEGRELLRALSRRSDILLETFPPGHLDGWGMGYSALAQENPGLITASITGFGQQGPYANYVSSDLVALAMGGLLSISGSPSRPPCKPPETQAFYTACAYAVLSSLIALYYREVSGRGQHIDVSMQEAIAVEDQILSSFANENVVMHREGGQHKQVSPANVFPCRDGFVYLFVSAAGNHWKDFLDVWPDHPAAFEAPEWASAAHRREHAAVINEAVCPFTNRFSRAELVELMQSRGIPCLPVNTPREFLSDEQIQVREFLQPVPHPKWDCYRHTSVPYFVDGHKTTIIPAPAVGQNNAEIYGDLLNINLDDQALLRASNVI